MYKVILWAANTWPNLGARQTNRRLSAGHSKGMANVFFWTSTLKRQNNDPLNVKIPARNDMACRCFLESIQYKGVHPNWSGRYFLYTTKHFLSTIMLYGRMGLLKTVG
jgi:hypothetical protein